MPRDRYCASYIGPFACRTFPRDTKASKRARETPKVLTETANQPKGHKKMIRDGYNGKEI
ncbi:MAG: hypothetical protein IM574_03445 [Cytophagales bacterium]|nr:hypothetical protein [Cytophagales bacterium]MCA6397597.1 hypothetical protein [Cytophagales bacterium]MCA6427662.1 hypothetical protein [Cytophagales bacterium]MCA6428948.1 hypothetical protein [Cytophagales bacterium]MCA6432641.1 hypothetical protein [Cytophagales bacterium]